MNTEIQCVQCYDSKIKKLCAIGHRGGNAWEPSPFCDKHCSFVSQITQYKTVFNIIYKEDGLVLVVKYTLGADLGSETYFLH